MKTHEMMQVLVEQVEINHKEMNADERTKGASMYQQEQIQLLTQSADRFEFLAETGQQGKHKSVVLYFLDFTVNAQTQDIDETWNRYSHAALLVLLHELGLLDPKEPMDHKKYTRKGMIKRVLDERKSKAESAQYRIQWASNIYGDHLLTNEKGVTYKVLLRDFQAKTGYSDSMDSRINKLGTTKHIMYVFNQLEKDEALFQKLDKTYPFIEVFCDPLNDYRITWHYPHTLNSNDKLFISRYFGSSSYIKSGEENRFLGFLSEAALRPHFMIRPEVISAVEEVFEVEMLRRLQEIDTPGFDAIKMTLFPYQKEGVAFALYRKVAIIADEMGLGKTLQAIATAVEKKRLFDFRKCLIVCPASLKEQWKKEIEKATDERAIIIEGFPDARVQQYKDPDSFFCIANYETIMRDQAAINEAGFDFLILDEAQRIKNYETKTAAAISRLRYKHVLVITGTPIENRLIDLFSLVSAIHPSFFGPLWEFSYQHCLFDPEKHNKINGYYNLHSLNKKMESIMIRREKRKVIEQLPHIQQVNVPLNLSPIQADYHASYARSLSQIISKKYLTPFDMQRIQLILANMRMVCDSSFLVDANTNESPKLQELKHILLHELNLGESQRKVLIFSEWVKMHKLIARMLRENNIGFAELNGSIPVKHRGELIRRFEENPQTKVFLSTEAGGSGLNLQVADVLINFELPWNPAKKNQRAGRIDRLGQRSSQLTIINLITRNSIEERIASGLLVKQSLFDGVMGEGAGLNYVDFSSKGRPQFIQQLAAFLDQSISGSQSEVSVENLELQLVDDEAFGDDGMDQESIEIVEQDKEEHSVDVELGKITAEKAAPASEGAQRQQEETIVEVEKVMNSGMQFLAGMFKMATGKEIAMEGKSVEVDRQTGEVIMRFRLPV